MSIQLNESKYDVSYSNGAFDFHFLPSVINEIINKDLEEMVRAENIKIHRFHFNKSLDIIKALKKNYDISTNLNEPHSFMGFVMYRLDLYMDEEIDLMGDMNTIFSFKIDNENHFNNLIEHIDEEERYEVIL